MLPTVYNVNSLLDIFNNIPFEYKSLPIDVIEHDNFYEIVVDLPGIKREEIDLQVKNNILTIKTQQPNVNCNKTKYLINERGFCRAKRSLSFNNKINDENIEASLSDGILNIKIYKKEEEYRKITIN